MKIAIISDSHDNVLNIEKFLDWADFNKIKIIIHCGDLSTPSVLENQFGPKFKGQFHFVHGNVADRDTDEEMADEFDNLTCHGDVGTIVIPSKDGISARIDEIPYQVRNDKNIEVENLRIAFCHFPDVAKDLARSGKFDLVFYGHTHKPWMETLDNGAQIINPGTLAGLFAKATFAVYDTDNGKLELKILTML